MIFNRTILVLWLLVCLVVCLPHIEMNEKTEKRDDMQHSLMTTLSPEQKREYRIIMKILHIYKTNPKAFAYGAKKQRDRFMG